MHPANLASRGLVAAAVHGAEVKAAGGATQGLLQGLLQLADCSPLSTPLGRIPTYAALAEPAEGHGAPPLAASPACNSPLAGASPASAWAHPRTPGAWSGWGGAWRGRCVLGPGLSGAASSAPAHLHSQRRFLASPSTAASPAAGASVDPREAAKFGALAASWWSPSGPFAPLHALNPARVRFVRESLAACRGGDAGAPEPLKGLRVLDVGCGGGVLSESLARLGASVTGIDVAAASVAVAAAHAGGDPLVAGRVSYRCISAEDLAASGTGGFDAVIASEVLEHVRRPHDFLAVLASLLAPPEASPGAAVIISTINRTPAAWAFAIAGAEYVARVVPPGTHSFKKFVTPQELAIMADASGLKLWHASGMAPLGPGGAWALTGALDVNYIATLRRAGEVQAGGAEGPGAGPGAEAGAGAGAERQ